MRRRTRWIIGAAGAGALLVGGAAGAEYAGERIQVDAAVGATASADRQARHDRDAILDTAKRSGADAILDDPYFGSGPWRAFVRSERRADEVTTAAMRRAATRDAETMLFPGPRKDALAYAAAAGPVYSTEVRLQLYVLTLRQDHLDGRDSRARRSAEAMFGDADVRNEVLAAALAS